MFRMRVVTKSIPWAEHVIKAAEEYAPEAASTVGRKYLYTSLPVPPDC
jgi:hypothetical protein